MILSEKEMNELRKRKYAYLPFKTILMLARLPRDFTCFQIRKGIPIEEMYHRTKVIFLAMNDPYQLSLTTHEIEGIANLGMNSVIRYPGLNVVSAVSMARLKRKLAGRQASYTRKMNIEVVKEWLSSTKRWVE